MSPTSEVNVVDRIAQVRTDFDRTFAEPNQAHDVDHVELLAVAAGGHPYALRLAQTTGLYPDRVIKPLPGPLPALLGLAGFAGAAVPVYDLATLLGQTDPARPRWMVLAAGTPPLALAFHEMHGHIRVAADAIVADDRTGHGSVRGIVTLPGGARPIVDVPATRALVHALTGHDQAAAEETR